MLIIDKDGKRIGVECFVKPQTKKVLDKIPRYRKHVDTLIFAVPNYTKNLFKNIEGIDEILTLSIQPTKKISIEKKNYIALTNLGKKGDTYNDIITKLLKKVKYNG